MSNTEPTLDVSIVLPVHNEAGHLAAELDRINDSMEASRYSWELILVDDEDNEIGYRSKAECHDGGGIRHRAFSLFLFNDDGELLLQQRSKEKRLWPGFWSNTCCSHPRRAAWTQHRHRR